MEKIISTKKLCKTFSNGGLQQHVLKNLDMEIYEGDFTILMGASGAGKSTLMYALSGMDKPTLGEVVFDGKEITKMSADELALFRREHCGFVFQQIYLVDSMSVFDNVMAAGLLKSKNKKEVAKKAGLILKALDVEENMWDKFPTQISGGEAQRVGIARALINHPKIILADEPTGDLDPENTETVLKLFRSIADENVTVISVTHENENRLTFADAIYKMENGKLSKVD